MILFLFTIFFSLRKCDYHLLLLWGLGHCQDMNVNFQFKNILWNTFSYFKIYLLFPWNRVLDFLTLPFRSKVSLNNWGLEKSYNTTVFSPSTRLSLHANTHWRQYNLGEVLFFFFPITGNWGVEVVGWGAWDCECWDELTVMQFGMLHFSNKIGSCAVFPQDRKKIHSKWHLFQEL